jgi:hypothetical protein
MKQHDVVELSVILEEQTGYDSIPIIERLYAKTTRGHIKCCFPDCKYRTPNPADMWVHIHFTQTHGLSFGVIAPDQIHLNDMQTADDGE